MNRRSLLKALAALCATPLAKPAVTASGDVVVKVAPATIHYPTAPTWMASGWYGTRDLEVLQVGDGCIVHESQECIGGCVCGAERTTFPPERLIIKPSIL